MNDLEEYDDCYRVLDLTPAASAEEVKTAWRDLVKVWHPDRFASEPRLQLRCQEKLKKINQAYETLKGRLDDPDLPVMYRPEGQLRCARCGRVLAVGESICYQCPAPDPVLVESNRHWTMTAIGVILIGAVVFHFAFDGPDHAYVYVFILLAGFACLRQMYQSTR